VLCVFERTTVAVACGDSLPQALVTRLAKTLPQLEKASTATRPRAACLRLRRGGRIARGAQRLATRARHQGRVPFDCAQAAVDAMTDLRARISALREEQC
jgi:hypothetical protein